MSHDQLGMCYHEYLVLGIQLLSTYMTTCTYIVMTNVLLCSAVTCPTHLSTLFWRNIRQVKELSPTLDHWYVSHLSSPLAKAKAIECDWTYLFLLPVPAQDPKEADPFLRVQNDLDDTKVVLVSSQCLRWSVSWTILMCLQHACHGTVHWDTTPSFSLLPPFPNYSMKRLNNC